MIIIPTSGTLAGAAPSGATEVTATFNLMELNDSTQAETWLTDQQQLAAAAATIYTATANGPTLIRSASIVNTDGSNASTFQLFVGGTAAANAITPVWTIPAGGMATYEDGQGWKFYDSNGDLLDKSGFTDLHVRLYTTNGAGTYFPTPGMLGCIVIATGAGGGGGGADTLAGGSGDVGIGAGGGAGGTAIGFYTAAEIGASKPFSIAGNAAGGNASGTNGANGGNTTWNTTTLVATGGTGGTGSGSTTQDAQSVAGGAGGVPTGGIINITGGNGHDGLAAAFDGATTDLIIGWAGDGGSSFWGGSSSQGTPSSGAASASLTTDVTGGGRLALVPGAGGGGARDFTSATGQSGGTSFQGAIVVFEFLGQP